MSLAEEKKLIKEIEQLKTSKKTAAQFMTQEEVSRPDQTRPRVTVSVNVRVNDIGSHRTGHVSASS